jgi:hypothetical protein
MSNFKLLLVSSLTLSFFSLNAGAIFMFDQDPENLAGYSLEGTITYKDTNDRDVSTTLEIKTARKTPSYWKIGGTKYGSVGVQKSGNRYYIQLLNTTSLTSFFSGRSKDVVIQLEIPAEELLRTKKFQVTRGPVSAFGNFFANIASTLMDDKPENWDTAESGSQVAAVSKDRRVNNSPVYKIMDVRLELKP